MKIEKRYADIIMILLIGLIPLTWFRDSYNALAGFDFAVYLNPVETLKKSYYLWSDMMAGGYDISHEISSVPYYLLFSLPVLLGASLYTAEKFVFIVIFTLLGLSIYYLLSVLFEKNEAKRAIAVSGAVIYTFSYPVMAHFGRGNMMALLTYGLLPFVLGLLHRGYTRPGKEWKYVMLFSLLSIPVSATKGHPADFVVLVGVVFYFSVFNIATSRNRARVVRFSLMAFTAALLVNLWWIVPNIVYLRHFGLSSGDLVKEGFYNLDLLSYYSKGTSILNVFRNERLDLWFDTTEDLIFNPGIYQSQVFVVIGLIIPAIAFSAICVAKRNKQIFFFSSLGIIAVFMGKGSHEPFGRFFEWMFIHLPGFFFFRAPYRIFSMLFTFAITPLAAFSIGSLMHSMLKTQSRGRVAELKKGIESALTLRSFNRIVTALLVFIFYTASISYAWPIFTGTHLRENGSRLVPGVLHRVPGQYFEANRWLRKLDGNFKVYFPYEVYDANTTWGYNGPDPSFELLTVPKVVSRPGGTVYVRYQAPIEALNRVVWDYRYGDLKKILSIYNILYALLHEDFNRWVLPTYNFNIYAKSLFMANSMELQKKTGPLDFYENDKSLPKIYAAGKGLLLVGDETSFPALSLAGYLDSPFLVMAKDVDGNAVERTVENVDGIVFYNSNTTDLVCELLYKKYGRPSKEVFGFTAGKRGLYYVFLKDSRNHLNLKGGKRYGAGDGFRWKKTVRTDFDAGVQTLKFEDVSKGQKVLVVPVERFNEVRDIVTKRLRSPYFSAAYVFTGSKKESGEVSLLGGNEYMLSVNVPVGYSKKKVNAWRDVLVTQPGNPGTGFGAKSADNAGRLTIFEYRNRASGKFEYVDINEYPKLHLNKKRYYKKKVMISLDLLLDGESAQEKMAPVEATVSYNGELDLSEIAKKRYSAGEYLLKGLKIVSSSGKEPENNSSPVLTRPELIGEFGLEKERCTEKGTSFSLAKQLPTVTVHECGQWSGKRFVKAGDYLIKGPPAGFSEYIVLLKKKVMTADQGRPPHDVGFEKINPTLYRIKSENVLRKLVFCDSFSSGWSLVADGKRLSPFKVNGYANGFIVPGAYKTMTLEYTPQKLFDYSKLASLGALTAVVAAGAQGSGKRKRH